MSVKDSLIGLLIIFIWGFNFVVIAWGVENTPPLLLGALRFIAVAVLGSLFVKRPDIPLRWMAAYALVLCFGQFSLLFCAIAFGMPAGLASIVLQSQAAFTILLSVLILNEQIKAPQIIAMFIAGIGLAMIGLTGENSSMTLVGFVLTIAAAFSWAMGNVINRLINQKGYQANLGLVVWSSWIAFIPFLLASLYFEGVEQISFALTTINLKLVSVVAYLCFCASIMGYSLWSYLLQHYPAGQVAPLTLGIPVVGLVSANLLLNESLHPLQIIGALLVMAGLTINTLTGKIKSYRNKKAAKT